MSMEALIVSTLGPLVGGRVYPDVAPQGVAALPRIVYQQVGGTATNFLDSATLPSRENGRFQIAVWAATRLQAAGASRQARDALRVEAGLHTTVLSEMLAVHEPETNLYGALQDFSFWT